METSLDFLSSLLDEVCLEGLDGTTLPTLWVRLQNRPHFPLALDDDSKAFLWECVAACKDIEAFELPDPRPVVQLYDRYDFVDPEMGIPTEPTHDLQADLYPVKIIEDEDIYGSCETYSTRVKVTTLIRHGSVLLMSLNQAMEKWGDRLVLVASPKLRRLALVGTEANPLMGITKDQYSLLERIGRSRFLGEVTVGERGLNAVKGGFRDHLHYHMKKLQGKNFITKQKYYVRNKAGRIVTGSLLHLTRFYVTRQTKYDALTECLENILQEMPGHRAPYETLREQLGLNSVMFKKLLRRHEAKSFKTYELPYSEMYPGKEIKKHKNGQEVIVRVLEMEQRSDEEESLDEEESGFVVHTDFTKISFDRNLTLQVYKIIEAAGPDGITLLNIQRTLTLPRLDVRTFCRHLVRSKDVITVLHDRGRQRTEKYIASIFINDNKAYQDVRHQAEKLFGDKSNNESTKENGEHGLDAATVSVNHQMDIDNDGDEVAKKCATEEKPSNDNLENGDFSKVESETIEFSENEKLMRTKNNQTQQGILPALIADMQDQMKKPAGQGQISSRILKRANMIVDFLKKVRICSIFDLTKMIEEEEKKEGYNFKIDRRSVKRLIDRLCQDQKVKLIRTILRSEKQVKELIFTCDFTLDPKDEIVKSVVEKAKFKFLNASGSTNKNGEQTPKSSQKSSLSKATKAEKPQRPKKSIFSASKVKAASLKVDDPLFSKNRYSLIPKFVRAKVLHLYLFYLVYDYQGRGEEKCDEPFVYNDVDSWKRFLPPLPEYKKKKGWCILSDAITCMPLSVFVRIVTLKYEIPLLNDVFEDPVKQNYLLRHLPLDLRNTLFQKRRYAFSIFDIVVRLCHMGLVSFGPRLHCEKEQVYIYLHKKAAIKNTVITPPSYFRIDDSIDYEMKEYEFRNLTDVENYWIDLENVCLSTSLNLYSIAAGQTIIVDDPREKPSMKASLVNKEFKDVDEKGVMPGDGLGAGGMDSSMFAHLRRNWVHLRFGSKMPGTQSAENDTKKNNNLLQLLLKGRTKDFHPQSRERLQRLNKRVLMPPPLKRGKAIPLPSEPPEPPAKKLKTEKRKKIKVRTIRAPNVKRLRQTNVDEKDAEALNRLDKLRADWAPEEDSFLLLCEVASLFFSPRSRTLVVSFFIVRDMLHEKFPHLSLNKTSRACQRRLRHMLIKSEETQNNVSLFLGEALQDPELVKEFGGIKIPRTNEDRWRQLFTSLVEKLLIKFASRSHLLKEATFPDNLSTLHSLYKVNHPVRVLRSGIQRVDPSASTEIYFHTVSQVVLSSINSREDGQQWNYTLYKIYDRFPQDLLKNVIDKLNRDKIITKVKMNERAGLRNFTSLPYRLSVTYNNAFISRYPPTLFSEAGELSTKLINSKNEGLAVSQIEACFAPGYIPTLLALTSSCRLEICVDIPDQVLVFSSSLTEKQRSTILETMIPSLTDQETQELTKLLNSCMNTAQDGACTKVGGGDNSPRTKKLKVSEETCSIRDNIEDLEFVKTVSRLALHMLRQQSSELKNEDSNLSQDYIAVNPCNIVCKLRDENLLAKNMETCLFPKILLGESHKDLMSLKANANNDFISEQDGLDSKAREVFETFSSYIPEKFLLFDHEALENHLVDSYRTFSDSNIYEEGKLIFETICSKGEPGMSHRELWLKFENSNLHMTLSKHMDIMLNSNLILRLGVSSFRYVAVTNSKPWIIPCFPVYKKQEVASLYSPTESESTNKSSPVCIQIKEEKECEEEVQDADCEEVQIIDPIPEVVIKSENVQSSQLNVWFVPKSWRKPDGSFNSGVLVKFLNIVMCYIMDNPGVREDKIYERFSLLLLPAQTLEVLEMLENTSCIFRYHLKCNKKSSLFLPVKRNAIIPEPSVKSIMYYEAYIDATLKLNKFCRSLSNMK